MSDSYDDIIHLPHPTSVTHPRMSRANRAAQFAPFAALTGYDAAVKETARLTNEQVELGESSLAILDAKLRQIADNLADQPEVTITYFAPDTRKSGGEYVTTNGRVKKLDDYKGIMVLASGEKIVLERVLDITSDLFEGI